MIVVKFGGSSLAGAERMLASARIVASHQRREPVVCVVSAMRGVTDTLLAIANLAITGSSAWRASYTDLRAWHEQTWAAVSARTNGYQLIPSPGEVLASAQGDPLPQPLPAPGRGARDRLSRSVRVSLGSPPPSVSRRRVAEPREAGRGRPGAHANPSNRFGITSLDTLWEALEADAAQLATAGAGKARDEVITVFSAWGERLAVRLFAAALVREGMAASSFEDAPVVVEQAVQALDAESTSAHWFASVAATRAWLCDPLSNLLALRLTPVLPGYLALRQDGQYTTLGRNGSDHSAAVIGAALDASAVYLYSDVAGIYQADPRIAPDAELLAQLSYVEAATIAARGARVLHPATIPPLARRGIPLRLRSALHPEAPGTDIGPESTPRELLQTPALAMFPTLLATAGCGAAVGRPDAF